MYILLFFFFVVVIAYALEVVKISAAALFTRPSELTEWDCVVGTIFQHL